MKKFLFCIFLTLLVPLGAAAFLFWDLAPKIYKNPASAERLLRIRLDHRLYGSAPPEIRNFALTHFPSLFPLHVICSHTGPDGKIVSILPGETVEANNHDLLLECSRDVKISLRKGSSIKIIQQIMDPHVTVLNGTVDFFFSDQHIRLIPSTNSFFLTTSNSPTNQITISRKGKVYSYACQKGEVEAFLYEDLPVENTSFILAKNCNLSVTTESGHTSTLNDGDIVRRKDLAVKKNLWPKEDFAKVYAPLASEAPKEMALRIKFQPTLPPSDNIKFVWSAAKPGPVACTLFVRNSEKAAATAAHTFQAQGSSGELLLQKGFSKYWTSLSCNSTSGRLDSNILSPQ